MNFSRETKFEFVQNYIVSIVGDVMLLEDGFSYIKNGCETQ